MAKTNGDDAPWDRKRPEGKKKKSLTPESRSKAKKRAGGAGRAYPNLVDNMWAAAEQGKQKSAKKKSATKKSAAAKKTGTATKTSGAKKKGGAKKRAGVRKRAQ